MTLKFNELEEIVNLEKACDEAQEVAYEASCVAFDEEGTPSEAAAEAAWEAASEALSKLQEALSEAKLRAMVWGIKTALEAAAIHFTVDMHPFTVYQNTPRQGTIPGATFRFPGHSLVLEAHEIFDEEDEAWMYSFGYGVEFHGVEDHHHWFVEDDLDELVAKVVDYLGENSERRAN